VEDRGLGVVNGTWGKASPLGKLYVQRHFPPSCKALMEEWSGNLRAAFTERLQAHSVAGR
jgi:predicted metalloendopeptidase